MASASSPVKMIFVEKGAFAHVANMMSCYDSKVPSDSWEHVCVT